MNLELVGSIRSPDEEGDVADRPAESGGSKSRLVTFVQGAVVFVAMFAVLWWILSRSER